MKWIVGMLRRRELSPIDACTRVLAADRRPHTRSPVRRSDQLRSAKHGGRNLIVMNIHRAKGKEFDEDFVYGEVHYPFVRQGESDLSAARKNMNVAVTRTRTRVTILTPQRAPSKLFTG